MQTRYNLLCAALIAAGLALAGPAHAVIINYSVGGSGELHFPSPVTPDPNSPHMLDGLGYPGDTVEYLGYSGTLDLQDGAIYVQKINTLSWTVAYTYGYPAGTTSGWLDENNWVNLQFNPGASRGLTLDTVNGSVGQSGLLNVTWADDYLSLNDGPTSVFVVDGYTVRVTPLGLGTANVTNFSGDPGWVQPTRDVMGRFEISAVPEPGTIVLLGLGFGLVGLLTLRRRAAAR